MNSSNMLDGWCSCLQCAQDDTCPHHKAIFKNDSNRMGLFGIGTRNLSPVQTEYRNQQWETFCVPCEEKNDCVILLVVFQRSALSSTVSTFGIVMMDMQESRLRKHVRERTTCSICHGIAVNRMICGHESEAMKTFVAQEKTIARERLHARNSKGDAEMRG